MSRIVYFLRHGETVAPPGVFIGSTDVELSAAGKRQAEAVVGRIPGRPVCLCSPLGRARQTLEPLRNAGVIGKLTIDARLREIDFGHWEGESFAGLVRRGVDLSGWLEYNGFAFPGGESIAGFVARLEEIQALLQTHPAEELLVVSHGGVIRTLLCLLLGIDVKNYLLFRVDHARLAIAELFSEGGVLVGLNR